MHVPQSVAVHSLDLEFGVRRSVVKEALVAPMLRITIMEEHDVATIRLEGKLVGPWVEELERCWNTAMAGWRNTQLLVDLNMVTFVDASGRALLTKMHNAGAKLMGRGILTTYILEQIGHCQAD